MNQAIFSYHGEKVWKFQDIVLIQHSHNHVILSAGNSRTFKNLYDALDYLREITGKSVVFRGEKEKSNE